MIPARAFWLREPGRGVLLEESLAEPREGWCRVRALYSAVSAGTERLVLRGLVPAELHEEMRCPYMGGRFPFPVKYGYSLVGRVEKGPAGLAGRIVHVLHPHQDVCVVRVEDAHPVPATVPADRATLASNLETAVTAAWDAGVLPGERALVVGFGTVGSLVARLLGGLPGLELEIAETRRERRELASDLGFALAPGRDAPPYDVAFEASGTGPGLQAAVDAVGVEGRVVALGWLGTRSAALALGGTFHSRRKRIVSSQVGRIPAALAPRWDADRRRALVFRLLEDPAFDRHLGRRSAFEELPAVAQALARPPAGGLGPLIEY